MLGFSCMWRCASGSSATQKTLLSSPDFRLVQLGPWKGLGIRAGVKVCEPQRAGCTGRAQHKSPWEEKGASLGVCN